MHKFIRLLRKIPFTKLKPPSLELALSLVTAIALFIQITNDRDNSNLQTRAYIGIIPNLVPMADGLNKLQLKIVNFGVSPALDVEYNLGFQMANYPFGSVSLLDRPTQAESVTAIFPQKEETEDLSISDEYISNMLKQQRIDYRLVTVSHVTYKDIFGRSHHTNFCMVSTPSGFYTYCNKYNDLN